MPNVSILDIRAERVHTGAMADDELNAEFGRQLRELRGGAGLSQDELANASGISRTSVVNIERGRQGVSLGTLYRLATGLGSEPQSLLPRIAPRPTVPKIAHGPNTPDTELAVLAVVRRAERGELD